LGIEAMARKKTPVRVDPKRPKRRRKRGKGKSIKKASYPRIGMKVTLQGLMVPRLPSLHSEALD